ncbi:MAG: hypothetical protein IPQ07_30595 [Myxococcales bacterium]|nr:hypothetical protein [Myxococcales bacterium]
MSAMVDRTCKALDKTVADAEKRYDTAIATAEHKAHAAVLAQLQKIKAEADKALAAIDAAFDAAMKKLDAAIENAYQAVESVAQGKALEIEVHVATLLADAGDNTRYAAVRKQLEWYVVNKQPIPSGYGVKPPPLSTEGAKPDEKTLHKVEATLVKVDGKGEAKPSDTENEKELSPEDQKAAVDKAVPRATRSRS